MYFQIRSRLKPYLFCLIWSEGICQFSDNFLEALDVSRKGGDYEFQDFVNEPGYFAYKLFHAAEVGIIWIVLLFLCVLMM